MIASLLLAFATAMPTVVGAQAAQPPAATGKPLRTLVYSVTFGTRTVNAEKGSGFVNGGTMQGSGSAETDRVQETADEGKLTVDVIAATADGGLVVDAQFVGRQGDEHPLRVAIYSNGGISYDPSKPLSIEAQRILPMLARGIVAGRDIEPGQTWTIGPANAAAQFSVTKSDGDLATIKVHRTATPLPGAQQTEEATSVYDTEKLCPRNYDLVVRLRRPNGPDQELTQTETLHATLFSDTFGT
jgi:hypothetical protein